MAELTLFVSAFLAATVFPLSSETTFLVALTNGMPLENALFFASSGNILAVMVNYFLGYILYKKTKTKLLQSKFGKRIYLYSKHYGYFALVFSWVPIIGDPITIAAGLLRLKFVWFVLITATLRFTRYYILALML